MKIFFDTCTIIDYLCNRNNSANVDRILQLADDNRWECIISAGSFYTITYLIEPKIRKQSQWQSQLQ